MNLYLIKETKAFVIQVTFLCAAVWTHRWWRGSCVLWSSALVWAQISGIHLSQLFSLWATCTRVFLPGLWAHSRLHVSSHNTDQLYQLRASSQVFLQDLLITPSHIVYPLAHQKSQNSVKSFISVKKKRWNSDIRYSDNGDRIWIFEIHRWCIFSFKQRALFIVDVDAFMPSATWRVLFVLDTEVCCPLAIGPSPHLDCILGHSDYSQHGNSVIVCEM